MGPELVIAGWFAGAAIGQLIGLPFSYMKEHPVWLRLEKELQKLHDAVQLIQAAVEKIEKLEFINDCTPAEKLLLWQLKDVMDETDDAVDELEYYKLKEDVNNGGEKLGHTASDYTKKIIRSTTFVFKYEVHLKNKLNSAAKNLHHVADSVEYFFRLHDLSKEDGAMQQQIMARESGYLLTEDKVFGREKEVEKIIGWLNEPGSGEQESSVKNVTVLPIVGMAGIGKTTLAQLVYGKGSFDIRMWVWVSNKFDVTKIMKKIIWSVTKTNPQAEELSILQEILTEKLKSKKFLLVLDDVWNDGDRKKWEDLVAPLKEGKQGSKILLTTRMDSVAKITSEVIEESEEPLNLQGIEWDQYVSLFNRYAFADVIPGDYKIFQLIGNQIAEKLGQSPLLAKIVGRKLNSEFSLEFWKRVLENCILNSIQNDEFLTTLRLSYIHLSPQLQSCLRFCSIFPQGHQFKKDELIWMWMAVGLIYQAEDKKRRPEDIGAEYFDILLQKSLFSQGLHPVGSKNMYYVIDDQVHEMLCCVSKDECLRVNYCKPNPTEIPATLRHLSIMVDDPFVFCNTPQLKNLHTLVLQIAGFDANWVEILNKKLKGFKTLRVLKLQLSTACEASSLNAIGHLKHLRYLCFDSMLDMTRLPTSVYKLHHLQTMIILGLHPSTEKMLKGFRSLIKLRHLILPLEILPRIIGIGKLTSLQNLDEFHVGEGNGCRISELKNLRELHGQLHIKNIENVRSYKDAEEAKLFNKQHLRSLLLHWDSNLNSTAVEAKEVIDMFEPNSNIEKLEINGYSGVFYPCWLGIPYLAMLEFITSITLSNCKNLKFLPPLEKLPHLKFLCLENMRALTLVGHRTAFPSLEVLKVKNIPQLKKWSGIEDGPCFPCIKTLDIEDCSSLMAFPPLPHTLERLEICNVGFITLPRFWQCRNNDYESSSGLLQCTDHFMLQHNAPHHDFFLPSSVQNISLMDYGEMDASLPGALQQLANLSVLHLSECTSITSFPSAEVFRRLKMLPKLSIVRCTELTSLGGLQALISLKCLEIKECHKLVAAATAMPPLTSDAVEGAANGSSLSLDILEIDDPSLLHLEPLRSLTSVHVVHLWDCSRLISLPEEWLLQVRSSLQVLWLYKAVSLKFLPVSLKEFCSLQELVLSGPPLLQSLPELPNSLDSLRIYDHD